MKLQWYALTNHFTLSTVRNIVFLDIYLFFLPKSLKYQFTFLTGKIQDCSKHVII